MAQGFLKSFDENLEVFSAGTEPSNEVHPLAIQVMNELGINISGNHPVKVDKYLHMHFDFVITVCDGAQENCPVFSGKVIKTLHIGFDDPVKANGTQKEILDYFRKIRDEIRNDFYQFYLDYAT